MSAVDRLARLLDVPTGPAKRQMGQVVSLGAGSTVSVRVRGHTVSCVASIPVAPGDMVWVQGANVVSKSAGRQDGAIPEYRV